MRRWEVQNRQRQCGVCRLRGRDVLDGGRRDDRNNMPRVPGERDVGGGERLAGVLHLSERVRARGGDVDVQDLRPRHVQQPARAHGVLELLAGPVLRELRSDRQRDVFELCTWRMVAGGKSELQPVPGELVHWSRKRVADELRV